MHPSIYSPEEDSYLMSNVLKKEIMKIICDNPNAMILEIGSGSGINLQTTLELGVKKENIFSCDINPEAVKHCKKLGFNCIESNLFEKIPKQKFNLIIFNPPYLPEDKLEPENSKIVTTAGKKGNEIILRFLKQAKTYLYKSGKIFLITSSLSEEINFEKKGYSKNLIETKSLFFEKLFLWELSS